MLIEFYGRNFGCFRDEFRLSMLATDIDPESDRGLVEVAVEGDDEPLRLLRAVALYGPNASGKSTLVRAAAAFWRLLAESATFSSDEALEPYEPFALGVGPAAPVHLGIKAVIAGVVHDYSISYDQAAIRSERLERLSGKPSLLFSRTGQEVRGEWMENKHFRLVTSDFRANALLLSLAGSLAPQLATTLTVGLRNLLRATGLHENDRVEVVAKRAISDRAFGDWLVGRLRLADVGVSDLKVDTKRVLRKFLDRSGREVITWHLLLEHAGARGPTALPYLRESLGTRRLISLAPMMYDLTSGRDSQAAFVDELDASMHPTLLESLVRHLNCEIPLREARGQLIFTTHETTLLDAEAKDAILRRDQVYFTEKDASGASRLYSVAEFKERNNLNLRRRYLQGRYGALPALGTFTE